MPSADFLARFGILIRHAFLPSDLCERIIADIRSGNASQAEVGNKHGVYVVDGTVRRVSHVEIPEETLALIEAPLRALKTSLEAHFKVALSHYQRPNFLHYRIGDHYVPHSDSRHDEAASSSSREREVSV